MNSGTRTLDKTGRERVSQVPAMHVRHLVELSRVGSILTSTFDLERILSLLMELSLQVSRTEVGSIMLVEGESLTKAITWGLEDKVTNSLQIPGGEGLLQYVLRTKSPFFFGGSAPSSLTTSSGDGVFVTSLACVPLMARQRLVGILTVVNRADDQPWTDVDVELLRGIAQFAAVAIENARLHGISLEKQALEKELSLAREVQMGLLPAQKPAMGRVDIAAEYIPAEIVGGDYYDFIELGPEKLAIVIGDVSSKGVPAALYMTATRGVLRSHALVGTPPAGVLEQLNQFLCADFRRNSSMFVSLFYGVLDSSTGCFTYSNAGHCPPVILRAGGARPFFLTTGNTVLGQLPDLRLDERVAQIFPGDCLVFYTDGITEARNSEGRIFGKARLMEILEKHSALDVSSIARGLLQSVEQFERKREDDLTLLVMRITG